MAHRKHTSVWGKIWAALVFSAVLSMGGVIGIGFGVYHAEDLRKEFKACSADPESCLPHRP